MKIILTTHQFFPDNKTGTEVLVHGVAKEMQRCGHEVVIFSSALAKKQLYDHERFDTYYYDGLEVKRFWCSPVSMGKLSNVIRLEYDNRFVAKFFRALLSELKPDVVHFFHLSRLTSSIINESTQKNIPAYFTPTDFWSICPTNQLLLPNGKLCSGPDFSAANCMKHLALLRFPFFSRLLRCLPGNVFKQFVRFVNRSVMDSFSARREVNVSRINTLKGVFVPNYFMMKQLEKYGVSGSLMKHLPYGLQTDSEQSKKIRQTRKQLQVGFVGTLSQSKGAHLLIKALRDSPDLHVDVKIYGDLTQYPEYATNLLRLAGGDSRINFLGTFDKKDIEQVFLGLDVLVVPSIWYENTPLIIYSAQMFGCPVIASDLGSIPEVVFHGRNGLLFSRGESGELAESIIQVNRDRALLRRLSDNAISPKPISDYVSELLCHYKSSMGVY